MTVPDEALQEQVWIDAEGTRDLVSIVIPTCNRAGMLAQTIESIVAQDYRPIQVVVVDDDSTDNTEQEVQSLISQTKGDIDLSYHKQPKAGGPAARNHGARQTTGEFVVFMDDDDFFCPRFVTSHVQSLRANQDANVSFCRWQRFEVHDSGYALMEKMGEYPRAATSPWEAFLRGWSLLLQGCMIRRATVCSTGPWRQDLHKSQDLDYKVRLLAQQRHVVEAPDAYVLYRLHKASVTGQLDAKKLESYCIVLDEIQRIACQRDDYETLRSIIADYLWSHAYWLNSRGVSNPARHWLARAKQHDKKVTRRNGPRLYRMLSRCGLDFVSGPLMYRLFQAKVWMFGMTVRKANRYVDKLENACFHVPSAE